MAAAFGRGLAQGARERLGAVGATPEATTPAVKSSPEGDSKRDACDSAALGCDTGSTAVAGSGSPLLRSKSNHCPAATAPAGGIDSFEESAATGSISRVVSSAAASKSVV